ncbi:MAG: hypothetical protein V4582_24260 [Pseudomonadota bacterium]
MKLSKPYRALCGALCAAVLGACASAPALLQKPPTLDELMAKASQAAAGGQREAAIASWRAAAQAFPAEKTPWIQMAQSKYDAGQYGDAIVNAQEVLVRDPNDKLANSIIAISGLRLSTRALGDLSRQNGLSGSLRSESQDLAKLLRESLGEAVLVPAHEKTPVHGNARKAAKRAEEDGNANPFGNLK